MAGGITFDGRYVSNQSNGSNLAGNIELHDNDPNFVERAAQRKPESFIDPFVDWIDEADKALFARYGQDWWTGVLYIPARKGLMGPTAKRNMVFHGDRVYYVISSAYKNKERIYKLVTLFLSLAYGGNEKYEQILSCVAQHPEVEKKLDVVGSKVRQGVGNVGLGFAKRMLGGAFVSYAVRGGKYGNKMLGGKKKAVGIAQIPVNMIAATWGSWIRMSTNISAGAGLSIFQLVNSMLTGSNDGFDLDTEDMRTVIETAEKCGIINEQDAQFFYAILQLTMEYYEEHK